MSAKRAKLCITSLNPARRRATRIDRTYILCRGRDPMNVFYTNRAPQLVRSISSVRIKSRCVTRPCPNSRNAKIPIVKFNTNNICYAHRVPDIRSNVKQIRSRKYARRIRLGIFESSNGSPPFRHLNLLERVR